MNLNMIKVKPVVTIGPDRYCDLEVILSNNSLWDDSKKLVGKDWVKEHDKMKTASDYIIKNLKEQFTNDGSLSAATKKDFRDCIHSYQGQLKTIRKLEEEILSQLQTALKNNRIICSAPIKEALAQNIEKINTLDNPLSPSIFKKYSIQEIKKDTLKLLQNTLADTKTSCHSLIKKNLQDINKIEKKILLSLEIISKKSYPACLKLTRDEREKGMRAEVELVLLQEIFEEFRKLTEADLIEFQVMKIKITKFYLLIYYFCLYCAKKNRDEQQQKDYQNLIVYILKRKRAFFDNNNEALFIRANNCADKFLSELMNQLDNHRANVWVKLRPDSEILKQINEQMPQGDTLKLKSLYGIIYLVEKSLCQKLIKKHGIEMPHSIAMELLSYLILSYMGYRKKKQWAKSHAGMRFKIRIGKWAFDFKDSAVGNNKKTTVEHEIWAELIKGRFTNRSKSLNFLKTSEVYTNISNFLKERLLPRSNVQAKEFAFGGAMSALNNMDASKLETLEEHLETFRPINASEKVVLADDLARKIGVKLETLEKYLNYDENEVEHNKDGEPITHTALMHFICKLAIAFMISEEFIFGVDPYTAPGGEKIIFKKLGPSLEELR